jgi:PAS domain S-box-containing protein
MSQRQLPPPALGVPRGVQASLARNEERFRDLFMRTTLPQALTDIDGRFVMANTAYCDLVGYSDVDLFHRTFESITHPSDHDRQRRAIEQLLSGRKRLVHVSKRYLRGDGATLWCRLAMAVVRDDGGEPKYLHGAIEDVRATARTSSATGPEPADNLVVPAAEVANRHVSQALATARNGQVQVVLIRLGGLEEIAGVVGSSGVELAHAQAVSRVASLSHVGIHSVVPIGLNDLLVVADAARVGVIPALLHAALRTPLSLGSFQMPVNLSIGVTHGSTGDDPGSLLRQARVALNEAVRGGVPERLYDATIDARALDDFALTLEIAVALAEGQFELHYQPKYRLTPDRLEGVEALLRWNHPERGAVPPERIVRLAESAGLIAPLTCWVIDQAVAQAATWMRAGTPIPVAINIAPQLLANPILPLRLSQALTRHRVPTRLLELEITETALSTAPYALAAVEQLAGLGFHVQVDDFGTGYSSLGAIKSLPLQAIKIDRDFVRNIAVERRDFDLVGAIIGIAHRLGSDVIAEGVEEPAVLDALRELNCDMAQGYLLGMPVPPGELSASLLAQASGPAWDEPARWTV